MRSGGEPRTLELMCGDARNVWAGKSRVKVNAKGVAQDVRFDPSPRLKGIPMNSIVYIVGAVVIIVALLSFLGLR